MTTGIDKLRHRAKPIALRHDSAVNWTVALFAFVIGMLAMRIGDELLLWWRQL